MHFWLLFITALFLAGCSSHRTSTPNVHLLDSIAIIAGLDDQLQTWHGTPYRCGDISRSGVDCSGFALMTMRDKFNLQLPRDMHMQSKTGTEANKDDLLPDGLVFFKTESGKSGLHVGIYDTNSQFIHASTNRGVVHSSLDSVYWRKDFWQA